MSAINVSVEGEPGHESWEIWMDTEENDDYHDGTIIGTGESFEEARDDAVKTLRAHVTELELMPHPDVSNPVTPDDEDDDDEDEDRD